MVQRHLAQARLVQPLHLRRRNAGSEQAIVKAGGNIAVSWDIDQVLREGDRGIGLPILSDLYARMANQPVPVDLDGLWRRLGISRQGDSVRFHDDAPLAGIRRAITASP